MTNDQFTEILAAKNRVGHIVFKDGRLVSCEGILKGRVTTNEAFQDIEDVWNSLHVLLNEIADLEEDRKRLNATLRSINAKTIDAMQGTARSEIPADWRSAHASTRRVIQSLSEWSQSALRQAGQNWLKGLSSNERHLQ